MINEKNELLIKLGASYFVLILIACIIYFFNINLAADSTEKGAVFTNLLVWTATLFTPIAAYFFYDSWKEQYNHTVNSKYYNQALDSFKTISVSIRKFKVLYENCQSIYELHESVDIQGFQTQFYDIKNELLLNLDIFQSELIFLQTLSSDYSERETLEKIFQAYIQPKKNKLLEEKISTNFYNSYTEHVIFLEDLKNLSCNLGHLIGDNIEFIANNLNSKIKA